MLGIKLGFKENISYLSEDKKQKEIKNEFEDYRKKEKRKESLLIKKNNSTKRKNNFWIKNETYNEKRILKISGNNNIKENEIIKRKNYKNNYGIKNGNYILIINILIIINLNIKIFSNDKLSFFESRYWNITLKIRGFGAVKLYLEMKDIIHLQQVIILVKYI